MVSEVSEPRMSNAVTNVAKQQIEFKNLDLKMIISKIFNFWDFQNFTEVKF